MFTTPDTQAAPALASVDSLVCILVARATPSAPSFHLSIGAKDATNTCNSCASAQEQAHTQSEGESKTGSTHVTFPEGSLVDVCPPLGEGWPNVGHALGLYIR